MHLLDCGSKSLLEKIGFACEHIGIALHLIIEFLSQQCHTLPYIARFSATHMRAMSSVTH